MNLTTKYQVQRNQYWPLVEQFFSNLPPNLFRQGVLLKNNLAIDYTDTGQFIDMLRRSRDYPLLYFHFWLLDDLHIAQSDQRTEFEQHVFLASVFTFAAIYTHNNILDSSTTFDNSFSHLEHLLRQQADFHLAYLFPSGSSFWGYHQTCWHDYSEAVLSSQQSPISLQSKETTAGKLAFGKIPVAAAAILAGHVESLPELLSLMDNLNFVFQVLRDIATVQRDIQLRRYTYPLLKTLDAANIDSNQPIQPEQLLGALVLTGSIKTVCQELLSTLDDCKNIATQLDLPTFSAYFSSVEDLTLSVEKLFTLKAPPPKSTSSKLPVSFFVPYVDSLARGIAMAEGYLLSDLTFSESWEVQRGGPSETGEMVGKAFPSGLIIEILCQHGHRLTEQVDQIFATLHETKFRYYDYAQLPPDADNLGLALRLLRFAAPDTKNIYRNLLQTPLNWMLTSILPSGEIPVWFETDAEGVTDSSVLIWGNSCAATEINLLFGLIDYDWSTFRTVIEKSALNLLDRFLVDGLSASLYYPPPYTLFVTLKLMSHLSAQSDSPSLIEKITAITEQVQQRFKLETHRPSVSSQDAAIYTLICASNKSTQHLFNETWIEILLKSQRYDGGWDDEPFFLIPDRGKSAWYSSRSLTTAYCYHALKSFKLLH